MSKISESLGNSEQPCTAHSSNNHAPSFVPGIPNRLAYPAKEAAVLLGGISIRSLRRLEQRGILRPSLGLRKKLYLASDLSAYLESTK